MHDIRLDLLELPINFLVDRAGDGVFAGHHSGNQSPPAAPFAMSFGPSVQQVPVDLSVIETFKSQIDVLLEELQSAVYEEAGSEFDLEDQKELAEVLFDKMALAVSARPKNGALIGLDNNGQGAPPCAGRHGLLRVAQWRCGFLDRFDYLVWRTLAQWIRKQCLTHNGKRTPAVPRSDTVSRQPAHVLNLETQNLKEI